MLFSLEYHKNAINLWALTNWGVTVKGTHAQVSGIERRTEILAIEGNKKLSKKCNTSPKDIHSYTLRKLLTKAKYPSRLSCRDGWLAGCPV